MIGVVQADAWWLGSVTVRTLDLRSPGRGFDSRSGRYQVVSTWMGDRLQTISVYNQHQGQLSLSSLRGRLIEYRPAWLGFRRGAFTCVGWQATLCDPIWQVTLRSFVMGFQSIRSYTHLYFLPLPFIHCAAVVQQVVQQIDVMESAL